MTLPAVALTRRLSGTSGVLFDEDIHCQSVIRPDSGIDYLPVYLSSMKETRALRRHKRR